MRHILKRLNTRKPPGLDRINKIFIIGFNKTATKTLHTFFKAQRIPSLHWYTGRIAIKMTQNAVSGRKLLHGYDRRYKVFSDMMYLNHRICIEGNSFYRILDRDYPGSLFIYSTRDEDAWIKSRLNHDDGSFLRNYHQILNTDSVDEIIEHWRQTRRQFEADMFRYFEGRKDLLVFDINTSGPETLGSFLNLDLDASKYVWLNKSKHALA